MANPDPTSAYETFTSWQATVAGNPAGITLNLKEIYHLVDDQTKRWYICVAFEDAMGMADNDRYCKTKR